MGLRQQLAGKESCLQEQESQVQQLVQQQQDAGAASSSIVQENQRLEKELAEGRKAATDAVAKQESAIRFLEKENLQLMTENKELLGGMSAGSEVLLHKVMQLTSENQRLLQDREKLMQQPAQQPLLSASPAALRSISNRSSSPAAARSTLKTVGSKPFTSMAPADKENGVGGIALDITNGNGERGNGNAQAKSPPGVAKPLIELQTEEGPGECNTQ